MPVALDLEGVPEALRAETWSRAAARNFPGLSARLSRPTPAGRMHGTRCGPGMLWQIHSPPLQVTWSPGEVADSEERFALLVQLGGETRASQQGRSCLIAEQDICVLDQSAPFQLEVREDFSRLAILQMPRNTLLGRCPWLQHRTAETLDPRDPGTILLRGMLLELLTLAPALDGDQQVAVLAAIQNLLAAPRLPARLGARDAHWRIRMALGCIDSRIADSTLTASDVAAQQGISRRRLDDLMRSMIGCTVSARIWTNRLEQAATDLIDPRHAARTVTQIAFSAGFEDSAHFTRAFKARYGCTPSDWRGRFRDCQHEQ